MADAENNEKRDARAKFIELANKRVTKAIKDITDLDTYKSDALKRGTYTATLQKDSIDLLNNCTKIEEVYRLGILNYITDFTKKFTERTSNSAKLQLQIDAEIKKITTPGIIKP